MNQVQQLRIRSILMANIVTFTLTVHAHAIQFNLFHYDLVHYLLILYLIQLQNFFDRLIIFFHPIPYQEYFFQQG